MAPRYILGSRSPQRLELLRLIVPAEQIDVVPPASTDEPGFNGLTSWDAIQSRLCDIVRGKSLQLRQQLTVVQREQSIVITADTIIVVWEDPRGRSPAASATLRVLGQPPDDDRWRSTVQTWFRDYYAGRTHLVVTALRVDLPGGEVVERVVITEVTMRADVECWLDWYLDTGEPRGKAGGYALQGAGSVFIEAVEGSASNVIGLPLEALLEIFKEAQG